jgi:hypothetical protein
MPHRRLSLTLIAALWLAAPPSARAQRIPTARHVASVVVGEVRLELLAYDDGTVTAGADSTMTSALARWKGDELRVWLDTANAVMRYSEPVGVEGDVTVSTPIAGLWLVRKLSATGSTYVLSVISPASPEVLDAMPSAAQVHALLKSLGKADGVMRGMTPDSLLHRRLAGRTR